MPEKIEPEKKNPRITQVLSGGIFEPRIHTIDQNEIRITSGWIYVIKGKDENGKALRTRYMFRAGYLTVEHYSTREESDRSAFLTKVGLQRDSVEYFQGVKATPDTTNKRHVTITLDLTDSKKIDYDGTTSSQLPLPLLTRRRFRK